MAMESQDTPYLPQEIITNILKRLPVKSQIRFQCVCKDWKNVMKAPFFIQEHLNHSTDQNPFLLFRWGSDTRYCRLALILQNLETQVLEFLDPPMTSYSQIVNCSNGLVCIENYNSCYYFLLWNPATREVRQVSGALHDLDRGDRFLTSYFLGFGFSQLANDYKIVRIFVSVDDDEVDKVEVYSLNTDSWKEVNAWNFEHVVFRKRNTPTVTVNGAIFWHGLKYGTTDLHVIISFDIALEEFALIPYPPVRRPYDCCLSVYENKLAMVSFQKINIGHFIFSWLDLWVMEESPNESGDQRLGWIKRYSSNLYPCWLCPVTIWRNEIVCDIFPEIIEGDDEENVGTKIVLCNITTNEFKMSHIRIKFFPQEIYNYAESLVPVHYPS
ncbi:F-box/kelch-repeat protein At3g23880-like [Prosopis cineraria]|uniref:F-box/kelch-repeat protein At3g23880-like n=1 Tax=Prosopis cineraria TaxID=364024 RepID=UPI00240EE48D|nr:F-box/kelch-repeat protein At3g23880-like [Prosopis cineraria]